MTIQARIILGLILCALAYIGGWKTCSWRDQAKMDRQDKQIIQLQQDRNTIAGAYESNRQNATKTISDLQKQIRREHAANPASTCVLDSDGVQSINQAIDTAR